MKNDFFSRGVLYCIKCIHKFALDPLPLRYRLNSYLTGRNKDHYEKMTTLSSLINWVNPPQAHIKVRTMPRVEAYIKQSCGPRNQYLKIYGLFGQLWTKALLHTRSNISIVYTNIMFKVFQYTITYIMATWWVQTTTFEAQVFTCPKTTCIFSNLPKAKNNLSTSWGPTSSLSYLSLHSNHAIRWYVSFVMT